METKESNRLIARFIGWEEQTDPTERWLGSFRDNYGKLWKNTEKEPLLFHTSWDWLIPVVEKILNKGYTMEGVNLTAKIRLHLSTPSLLFTYNAVVEFIKWYNKQNKDFKIK